MPKDFPKQDSRKAVGLPASGKGKATVRKHQGGGKTSGLGGGKPESSK
jgi:hypothetical protein